MDSRKRARAQLKAVEQSITSTLVIHYSCESFIDKADGYSPRVSSVAIRNLGSGQTYSFSIHIAAELAGIPKDEIANHCDDLERQTLDAMFEFLEKHKSAVFVHWNMRDANYGFEALYHRYKVLEGNPTLIDENRLVDLARVLVDIHGQSYAQHPRLKNL